MNSNARFQSYQRSQEILREINFLCIAVETNKVNTEKSWHKIVSSTRSLKRFLIELASIVENDRNTTLKSYSGVSLAMQQLASQYLLAKQERRFASTLFTSSIRDAISLISEPELGSIDQVLESLDDLRTLIEEYLDANTPKSSGEMSI